MSFTTIPQLTLPENRPTPSQGSLSRYEFRTAPYDALDPGPWPWHPATDYKRDLRTGRHRRNEAPDPLPTTGVEPDTRPGPRPDAAPARLPSPHPIPPADPFARLREEAWTRFLERSESLAKAHNDNRTKPRTLWSRLVRALRKAVPGGFGRSSSVIPLRLRSRSKAVSAA